VGLTSETRKIRQVAQKLEKHKDVLPGKDAEAREEFYTDLKKEVDRLSRREPEDRRQAAIIAVDASKTFVHIGVAVVAVIGAFLQYGFTRGWNWESLATLGLAALATLVSMSFGMRVISRAYKRGDGREAVNEEPWSTLALKQHLGRQAIFGLAALGLFVAAIGVSFLSSPLGQGFKVTLPDGTEHTSPGTALTITGRWTELSIADEEVTMTLKEVPEGETRSIELEDE
jgi:hypothetical protein